MRLVSHTDVLGDTEACLLHTKLLIAEVLQLFWSSSATVTSAYKSTQIFFLLFSISMSPHTGITYDAVYVTICSFSPKSKRGKILMRKNFPKSGTLLELNLT